MVQVHGGVQPSAGGNYRCLFILTCLRLGGMHSLAVGGIDVKADRMHLHLLDRELLIVRYFLVNPLPYKGCET